METTHRPHGRDEVIPAVQAAAIALLAERGPRDVTVREIAERAGVNHALVHRHFGTKDEFIRAVLSEQSRAIAAAAAELPRDTAAMLTLLDEHRAYFRALARAVLDSPTVLDGADLPAASAFMKLVGQPSARTRDAAATAGALALGWLVFGEHLARALGMDDPDGLRGPVAAAIDGMTRTQSTARK